MGKMQDIEKAKKNIMTAKTLNWKIHSWEKLTIAKKHKRFNKRTRFQPSSMAGSWWVGIKKVPNLTTYLAELKPFSHFRILEAEHLADFIRALLRQSFQQKFHDFDVLTLDGVVQRSDVAVLESFVRYPAQILLQKTQRWRSSDRTKAVYFEFL